MRQRGGGRHRFDRRRGTSAHGDGGCVGGVGMTRTAFGRGIRLERAGWLVLAAGLALVTAACGDAGAAVVTVAPAATAAPVSTTTTVAATTTTTAVTTTTAAPTTTTSTTEATVSAAVLSPEQLAAAAAVGDIAAGEALFNAPVDGVGHSLACVACHSLDGKNGRNPTIVGISGVAADRVAGMSAVDYLRQSIVDPYAFKVDGEWHSAAMPYQYPNLLSEEQIDNLVAFLLTR